MASIPCFVDVFLNPFPVTVGYYPTNLEESGITRLTQNFPVDVFSKRCTGVWTSCLQGCEALNHFFSLLTLNMSTCQKFAWTFVHVYLISSSSQKWFSHFVLTGFWQRIWVTVTFQWLGVYTPNFDVYLLGIFGCSPLHSYGLLVYLWILYSSNSMRDDPSRVHAFCWRYQYIL